MLNASITVSNIPSPLQANQLFQVSVTIVNTGDEVLNESGLKRLGMCNQSLGGDDYTWTTTPRWVLPSSINPGQSLTFLVNLKAPGAPGVHAMRFRALWEGHLWFGGASTTSLVINPVPVVPVNLSTLLPGWRTHGDCVGVRLFNTLAFSAGVPPTLPIHTFELVNDTGEFIEFSKLRVWIGIDIGTKGDIAALIDRVSADGLKVDTFYDQSLDHYADGWGHTDQILSFARGERILYPNEKLVLKCWYVSPGGHGHVGVNADLRRYTP